MYLLTGRIHKKQHLLKITCFLVFQGLYQLISREKESVPLLTVESNRL